MSTSSNDNGEQTQSTASAPDSPSDYTIAQGLQAIEQLTSVFQFTSEQAQKAVDAVGPDITLAYNYILDQGGEDRGGALYPKTDCPHIKHCVKKVGSDFEFDYDNDNICTYFDDEKLDATGSKGKSEKIDGKCPMGENWICLECREIRCSRYINGHCQEHWKNTKNEEIKTLNGGSNAIGHCIALSLQDLSVWCYECNAYLVHEELNKVVKFFENSKFSDCKPK